MSFGFTGAVGITPVAVLRRAVTTAVCLLVSVMLATALSVTPTAHAEPLNSDPAAGPEVAFPWTALGLPDEVTLAGANISQDFTIPVPSGFVVTRLRGLIHAPVDFGAGFVEIDDSNGSVLGTVNLPAVAPEQAVVPFDIDISTAQVMASELRLSLMVREPRIPGDDRCGLGEQVVLSDLAAVFTGAEAAPTTIADFFPPVLQRVTIYSAIDADDAEKQAVLTLASAVARLYRPQSPAITVVTHPRGAAPQPAPQLARAVVVERGDAGLAIVNPDKANVYLKVTGQGDELTDQASLIVNQLQSLAQMPDARIEQAGSAQAPDSDEMTFGDLGLSGERSVLRTSSLTVGVDRSALGASRVDGMKVHLLATHTPVASLDSATLMVRVNGRAVHTATLGESGRVDTEFDVPAEFLTQRISFDFDLTFSPRQLCSPTIAPLTFQLDPRSTVTVQRGGPALGGFSAVPSEFSAEFLVALDGSSPNQLDYATRVVTDIARLTGSPVMPRVVDVKAAVAAKTGALILANAATLEPTSIRPPIGGKSSDVQVDLRKELRADFDNGLGSIQVFADQPRERTVVLVTTNGAWSLVEPLLDYIDRLPDGWSSLEGDVLAAGTEGIVTNLSIGGPEAEASAPSEGTDWTLWAAIGAGCVVLVALIAGVGLWRRRGQRDDSSRPTVSET